MAMHEELGKLGGGLVFGHNVITVPKQALACTVKTLSGHNDHRIVMATAVAATVCSQPVTVLGAEAVNKSYPHFWAEYRRLGGNYE